MERVNRSRTQTICKSTRYFIHNIAHLSRYHNVGSIYIPCAITAGRKTMCTMYRYFIELVHLHRHMVTETVIQIAKM